MDNKRMQQLIIMFSHITGISQEESRRLILQTDTGKAIADNNIVELYEQQTENLYCIAMELDQKKQYVQTAQLFTVERIAAAMKFLIESEEKNRMKKTIGSFTIAKQPVLKSKQRKMLRTASKEILQKKKQNQINVRRIENAVKLEK